MDVRQALFERHSYRAYLSRPVEKEKLDRIFEAAARTPSWANSQPWESYVASGEALESIKKGFIESFESKIKAAPEIPRPEQWTEKAKEHQRQLHPDMVRDCGDDVENFGKQNQRFFDAPCVIFLAIDKILSEWSLYDLGAYSQSIMLAAIEEGLGTIPAIQLAIYPDVIRRELKIPDNLKIAIGIAIGYVDDSRGINKFVSARSSLNESVHYIS